MKDIVVNTRWDKKHCRFHSVEEMVEHYLAAKVWYNVSFALLDIVDDWWRKTEEKGGLGNYDIQCYELTIKDGWKWNLYII